MSQTLTMPATDPAEAQWHDKVKVAFGVASAVVLDGFFTDGIKVLQKTFANVRVQPPEIALRPLENISNEMAAAEIAATDGGRAMPPEAAAFRRQVDAEIAGLKARAADVAAAHATDWMNKSQALLAVTAPPDPAKHALAIQKLLAEIEPGVANDIYMLRQVGAPTRALQAVSDNAAILKMTYADLLPKRKTAGAPVPLTAVTKPAIKGALTGTEPDDLVAAMTSTQAKMAKDEPTDTAVVAAACDLIAKGINVVNAKAVMAELKSWEKVKARYRLLAQTEPEKAKAFMAEMWWYRRMAVDGVMNELQKTYDFIWGSVGSDNPESDYDLTVRTHPKKPTDKVKWDFQIVKAANDALSAGYGVPPGILFDTNLYAEAVAKAQTLTPEQAAEPAVKAMGAMKEQGQDVGALMKLRRFMAWDEFEDYKAKMLEAIVLRADKKLVARQFDEADSLYFIARGEQLMKAAEQIADETKRAEEIKAIEAIPNTPEGQKKLVEMAEHLEHDAARSMAANNEIYVEKLEEVRAIEELYNKEPDPAKKAGLLARLKSYQADATFFAAEAYHSEGPLQHVVKAGQSSKLEVEGRDPQPATKQLKDKAIDDLKQEKLKALSPNMMLQSFNENLGDLLKDLRHYASEPFPGLGFYRASKYIERLCDAYTIISKKDLGEAGNAAFARLTFGGQAPAVVQGKVAGLVDIRGEKTGFAASPGVDPEEEKQAFAIAEMRGIFTGVATLPDLGKVASAFGQQVNSVVRNAITKDMQAAEDNPYFPAKKV
jgi:hypothetical protein